MRPSRTSIPLPSFGSNAPPMTPVPRMSRARGRPIFPSRLFIATSTTRESAAMAPIVLLAQALPTASSGVNWLYQFTNNLTNLTTQNGGALTQLGLTELAGISLFVLVSMVVNWNTTGMTFRIHHDHLHVGDLVNFL